MGSKTSILKNIAIGSVLISMVIFLCLNVFIIFFISFVISIDVFGFVDPDIEMINIDGDTSGWLVIPYLIVILMALAGINVTVVLLTGIISAIIAGLFSGFNLIDLFTIGGEGIESVGELIVITLLAAGMLGMIKKAGGIDFILMVVGRNIHSSRGAQMSIALLVGIVNLCTANNTVAIITVGSLAKKISTHYKIEPRKSASLLDTGSCIVQALIPYGAQTLMASSLAGISPVAPWPYLFYPQLLILFLILSIVFIRKP